MTKEMILSVLNPNNSRLDELLYDEYVVTLKDNRRFVGFFDPIFIITPTEKNEWKFVLKNNPINMTFNDQKELVLDGDSISLLDRL